MGANLYRLECITNLHMGSGDINFNIVDKEIERDPVTNFPTMYSTGVKGALKAFCKGDANECAVFGDSNKNQGNVKFLTAEMLFQAVRSSDDMEVYYLVTSKTILQRFSSLCEKLTGNALDINSVSADCAYTAEAKANIGVDRYHYDSVKMDDSLRNLLLKFVDEKDISKVIIIPDKDMKNIPAPVVARNVLDDNGISKNLWYEELIPHDSIFYLWAVAQGEYLDMLNAMVDKKMVQFGANASVGYGLIKLEKVDI